MEAYMGSKSRWARWLVWCVAIAGLGTSAFAVAEPSRTGDEAASVVRLLYKNYAWEALFAQSEFTPLVNQTDEELARYFSPSMVHLLHTDRVCREQTHEICSLDFDPLFASQDPSGVYDLEAVRQGGHVSVTFRQDADKKVLVDFKVIATKDGWKIDDIRYPDGSQLSLLLRNGK